MTNTTAERVRIERIVEHSSSLGEFKLEGLPELGAWEHTTLEATVTPKATGERQARFDLLDENEEYAGEVFASANATPTAVDASAREADAAPSSSREQGEEVEAAAKAARYAAYDAHACTTTDALSRSINAVRGIHLYLLFDKKKLALGVHAYPSFMVGPEEAGPYDLIPWVDEFDGLVFFFANHKERRQIEWVIGPDEIDGFVSNIDLYVGVANRSLPGSSRVADSQKGGATDPSNAPSVVEKEAFGEAPWQFAKDVLVEGADATNGGSALLLGARNSTIRIENYIKPAHEMAAKLANDVKDGKVGHLDARQQAVDGRNELLQKTRKEISPSARYASKRMKEDPPTLERMTEKKTSDLLAQYRGYADGKMKSKLKPAELARLKQRLDADSQLWAKHAAAIDAAAAHLRDAKIHAAMAELGGSPEVSMEIIRSSGKTNRWVSRGARWGRGLGVVGGAIGAADFAFDVVDEVEARNWHALAGEFGGFAGGIVGAELGAIFLASLVPGAGGAVVLFVSLIGGLVGSAAGGAAGEGLASGIVDGFQNSAIGAGLGPATATSQRGGMAGLYDIRSAHGKPVAQQLADAIFAMDEQLRKISHDIPIARNRGELESLQRDRLMILHQRRQLEDYLTAIKLGAYDSETKIPEEPPGETPAAHGDCDPVDDDCDWRTD